MLGPYTRHRIHEWLADRVSFIQYPEPLVVPLHNGPRGLRLMWINRPKMHWTLAIFPPPLMLFVPVIGVYASIGYIVFLFVYFRKT